MSAKVCDLQHANQLFQSIICKLAEEITANQAALDLSETPVEVYLQQSC
jgi:hypothetical protein